jgi:CxxC-x17-CxxC domain-containing protein
MGKLSQELSETMTFTDRNLVCRDCNEEFVFTAGEQEFYESRGLTNLPGRCPNCRSARKQQGGGSGRPRSTGGRSGAGAGGGYRESRPMFTAICASCGNEAQIPFQPRDDRPVYCSDCFQTQGSSRTRQSRW